MRIGTPVVRHKPRLEIIPLIDIMFFLLAAFMLVSLSMVHRSTVPVNLPTSTTSAPSTERDLVSITVDAGGTAYLDNRAIGTSELAANLATLFAANPELRVAISGDREARHGDIIRVLDVVRSTGIQRVAFELRDPAAAAPTP